MSRTVRQESATNCYHVVPKGAGDQILFESDRDKEFYLRLLSQYRQQHQVTVLAWCLMSNHVHLLVVSSKESLVAMMHDLGMRFAQYYNYTNGHHGPVFQSPFFSEPILNDSHLLAAVRYVHNNPQKSKICRTDLYSWSSYGEYVSTPWLSFTDLVLGMLGGVEAFKSFSRMPDTFSSAVDRVATISLNDDEAITLAKTVLAPVNPLELKSMPFPDRKSGLGKLKGAGIGVAQAARITGIGKSSVSRIYKKCN